MVRPAIFLTQHLRRFVDLEKWIVFVWTPATCPALPARPDIEVRQLDEQDFHELARRSDRWGDQARRFYFERGVRAPVYGFYHRGRLVLAIWVYTASDYAREPFQTLRLREREAEFKRAYSPPEFRHLLVYPYARTYLGQMLFRQGFERIYATIDPLNAPPMQWLPRLGMRRCGTVWGISVPIISARKLAIRRLKGIEG